MASWLSNPIDDDIDYFDFDIDIDEALNKYESREDITKWVENYLDNAADVDFAQQELIEYVTDVLYDDELRLLWTDIIQGDGHYYYEPPQIVGFNKYGEGH